MDPNQMDLQLNLANEAGLVDHQHAELLGKNRDVLLEIAP